MTNITSSSSGHDKKMGLIVVLSSAVVGVVIGAAVMYFLQSSSSDSQQLNVQLQQKTEQLQQAQLQVQTLATQMSLDQATQDALEQLLHQKQNEVGKLQEQLAFYEHLLPLSDKGTVHIRALDLSPQSENVINYRLLLQRPAGLDRFKGHIQFTAHGQLDGDSVTIVLNSAGADPANSTAIEFDQFLRTAGLLQIPEGLIIDAVTLHIYQGKQLRATHKITLDPV